MACKIRLILVISVAAVLGWRLSLLLPRERKDVPATGGKVSADATAATAADVALESASSETSTVPVAPALSPDDPAALRPPMIELQTGRLPWEQKLDAAEATAPNAAQRAKAIFVLLPSLPEEALAVAADRAVRQLADSDYAAIALPAVTNAGTDGQVLGVLFADLMERPDKVTLPALLAIAQNRAHPFAPFALDNLRLLLATDHGTDWTKWDAAVRTALLRKER